MEATRTRRTRREVLAGAGIVVLTGCTGSGPDRSPRATADQRLARRVVREIGGLAALYSAALAAHPGLAQLAAPLLGEHRRHVAALSALLQPTPSAGPSSPTASPSISTPPVSSSPAAARSMLRSAEQAASRRRRGQCLDAGPELARLLASIAGCEAAHAVLLVGA